MIEDQYHTRGTVRCRPENRCHVCQINASSLNNFWVKLECYGSRPTRCNFVVCNCCMQQGGIHGATLLYATMLHAI